MFVAVWRFDEHYPYQRVPGEGREWHDRVQRGKIVGADINFAGAEQHLECLLTHADVQAEYARSIKIRDTIALVVCGGNGRERQHAIRPGDRSIAVTTP